MFLVFSPVFTVVILASLNINFKSLRFYFLRQFLSVVIQAALVVILVSYFIPLV